MPMNRVQFQPGLSRYRFWSVTAQKNSAKLHWLRPAGPKVLSVLVVVADTPFTKRIFSTVQTCKMQVQVAYEFIHTADQSWIGQIRPSSLVLEQIHFHHPA